MPGRLLIGRLLARWHGAEWSQLYDGWDARTAEAEFAAMSLPGTIPTTWVAFDGFGRSPADVMGSVTLALTDDLPGLEHLSPWLVSLYVQPHHRGAKVAAKLVDRLMSEARGMGIERVHLFTAGQERYYLDRGWRTTQYAEARGHQAAVMVRHTDPLAARRAVCSRWITNPDFDGAYSYLRRGATPDDRQPLAGAVDPDTHPGLYLAGEAGSLRYPGTAHGAYFTGQEVARLVLNEDRTVGSVVVIGAGLAGLAAARALRDAGRKVVALEAGNSIGGRCHTDRSLGVAVHLGAAWLHGELGHPLAGLGADGPATHWEDSGQFIIDHGPHDPTRARRANDVLHQRLAEAARRTSDTVPDSTVPDSTIPDSTIPDSTGVLGRETDGAHRGDAAYADTAMGLLDELAEDPQHGLDTRDLQLLRTWLHGEVESLYAAPWHELSLHHGAEPYELPGDHRLISQPFDQLLSPLAHGVEVRTATRATAVRAFGHHRPDQPGLPRWIIELDHPETAQTDPAPSIEAHSVIVTVPIGVLRSGRLRFEPPLPPPVRSSLDRLGAGPVAKVCFRYDSAFWEPLRSFWLAGPEPLSFGLWFDASALAGVPMLCTFAVGDAARWAEQATEDQLCRTADELLIRCRVGRT